MKKSTKLLSLTMAATMAMSLAACGASSDTSTGSTATDSTATGGTAAAAGDIVNLRWVTVGSGMPENYDAWAAKMNEYLGEKIGVNIDVEVVPWGDWDNRRNVIVSTSGDYDILFTNEKTYTNDVKTGAFLNLDDLIASSAPELYKIVPEKYWEACKVDGSIYAVPTYKDSSQSEFIVWDKELAASTGIDVSKIHTLDEMTAPLSAIHKSTGTASFPLYKSGATYLTYEYDMMSAGLYAMGVRYDDANAKVVATYEQPDIMKSLSIYRDWYKQGIINSDAATKPEENNYKPCNIAQGWAGAAVTSWGPQMGVEAVAYQWGPTIISNDTVRGSLNCISSNCKNPEKALAFLQLVNTDTWVRDSFYYGLEGTDWEYTADKKVHRNSADWKMAGYTQGTFFAVTPTDEVGFNQWDEVKELNEKASPSVLLGFTLDITPISDQLANCIAINERYKGELLSGTQDPVTFVPSMMAEMRAAGFDDIVAEAQKQVDAFMASK